MRIHIEQTFGLMTAKWRILRQPLQICNYLCVLQDYTTFVLMRVMFMSTVLKILKVVKVGLCSLMLMKQALQEVLCLGTS